VGTDRVNVTSFHWTYTFNGVQYLNVILDFENGVFHKLSDDRAIFTIGGTDVSITKEQAIETAKNYVSSHSFTLSNGTEIGGFDVAEAQAEANLVSGLKKDAVMYPMWNVVLSFHQEHVGDDLWVSVWADTGEVSECMFGGSMLKADASYAESTPTAQPTFSTQPETSSATEASTQLQPSDAPQPASTSTPETNASPNADNPALSAGNQPQNLLLIGIGVAVALAAVAAAILLVKKRQ
jgi:hypothetical protein